ELPVKMFLVSDVWSILNFVLALLFSIPAINYFTHVTHITVAHSMGTTIEINTTILLASLVYIARRIDPAINMRRMRRGFKIFNTSLLLFWICLLAAGARKSFWMYAQQEISFQAMQQSQYFIYLGFLLFGIGIFVGLSMMTLP